MTTTGGSGRPQADNAGGSGGHPPTNSAGGSERHAHTTSVLARWEGGWRCRVEAGDFELIVDEPESAGGTGTGPMPTEYLLAAMASCYALALAWAAAKRGVTLPGLAVTATDDSNGTWQYSTDTGVHWTAIPAVSDASADRKSVV